MDYKNSDETDGLSISSYMDSRNSEKFKIDRFVAEISDDKFICYGFISHHEFWMYLILTAICEVLSNISNSNNINPIDSKQSDTKDESFDNKLNKITKLFSRIYLSNVYFSQRCLQSFSDILTICENKLEYVNIEFKLSIKNNNHEKLTKNIDKISYKLN
eukprot:502678_1